MKTSREVIKTLISNDPKLQEIDNLLTEGVVLSTEQVDILLSYTNNIFKAEIEELNETLNLTSIPDAVLDLMLNKVLEGTSNYLRNSFKKYNINEENIENIVKRNEETTKKLLYEVLYSEKVQSTYIN